MVIPHLNSSMTLRFLQRLPLYCPDLLGLIESVDKDHYASMVDLVEQKA